MTATRRLALRAGRGSRPDGFTLIELMVTIAVLALLVMIGVPTFRDVALGSRLSATANDLLASVQLARSEAIKRNREVTVCATTDGAACDGGADWDQGWIVIDADDNRIQRQEALDAGYRMTQAGGTTELRFQPIGIGMAPATIMACRETPLGTQERVVNISATGSVYIETTTTGACP